MQLRMKREQPTSIRYSSYLVRSFQPYLLIVIKKLIGYFGYTFDTTFFDNNFLRNIYICSAVNSFRIETALPHWTISEFFNELEKFLKCNNRGG